MSDESTLARRLEADAELVVDPHDPDLVVLGGDPPKSDADALQLLR